MLYYMLLCMCKEGERMNYFGIDFKWELNKDEQKFIKYLVDNGFTIKKHKQFLSKLKVTVEKDNMLMNYELSRDVVDMKMFFKMFERNWELTKQIYEFERG